MNYIYDILLNFNSQLWDFYEWDPKDNISHIRRIPLFKVNKKTLSDVVNYDVVIDNSFLETIYHKTEVFTEHKNRVIDYACIITNGLMAVAYIFNKKGNVIGRSSLLVDEEEEALELSERLNITSISYQCLTKLEVESFKTCQEIEKEKFIQTELSKVNDIDKLSYLYYECFNEKEDNYELIIERIKQELLDNWEEISTKIYNFFKVTSINK